MPSKRIREWARALLKVDGTVGAEHHAVVEFWAKDASEFGKRLDESLERCRQLLPKGKKREIDRLFQVAVTSVYPSLDFLRPSFPGIGRAEAWGMMPLPREFLPSRMRVNVSCGWTLLVRSQASEGRAVKGSHLSVERVDWSVGEKVCSVELTTGGGKGWKREIKTSISSGRPASVQDGDAEVIASKLIGIGDLLWSRRALLARPSRALMESLGANLACADIAVLPAAMAVLHDLSSMVEDRQAWIMDVLLSEPNVRAWRRLSLDEGNRRWENLFSTGARGPASFHELEESVCSGVLIYGDNVEAMRWLKAKGFRGDCVLTDPPYNTGNTGVYRYADRERADTWQFDLQVRLKALGSALKSDGVVGIHIDDHSTHRCRNAIDNVYGEKQFLGTMVWRKKVVRGRGARYLLPHTEYIHFASPTDASPPPFGEEVTSEMRAEYNLKDEQGVYKRIPLAKTGTSQSPRPNLVYDIEAPDGTSIPCPTAQWRWSRETLANRMDEIEFVKGRDGKWRVFTKQRLMVEGKERLRTPSSLYDRVTTSNGTKEIKDIFGFVAADFPKPTKLLDDMFSWISTGRGEGRFRVLDIYAGSGSTLDAIFRSSSFHGSSRTVVGVERADYFEELTVERVARVMESNAWKKGEPCGAPLKDTSLHVIELDSFEDRLVARCLGKHD